MEVLTKMCTIGESEPLLTGKEVYPIVGTLLTPEAVAKVQTYLAGLRRHWHCIEKAQIVQKIIRGGRVVVGRMHVMSKDGKSMYGYEFNPPYEFHAWVQYNDAIIDFALPGVIEKGLTTVDELGPYLTGVEPSILVGLPPAYIHYEMKEVI